MKEWQQQHVTDVTQSIINEFQYRYAHFLAKNDSIYACSIILDDDGITSWLAVSTHQSLENEHFDDNNKWTETEWIHALNIDNKIENDLGTIGQKIFEHYDMLGSSVGHIEDWEPERQSLIDMYIKGMKQAKQQLVQELKLDEKEIIFYVAIPGEPDLSIQSAKIINVPCALLDDAIEDWF